MNGREHRRTLMDSQENKVWITTPDTQLSLTVSLTPDVSATTPEVLRSDLGPAMRMVDVSIESLDEATRKMMDLVSRTSRCGSVPTATIFCGARSCGSLFFFSCCSHALFLFP